MLYKSPKRRTARPFEDFAHSAEGRIRRDTRRAAIAAKRAWLEM